MTTTIYNHLREKHREADRRNHEQAKRERQRLELLLRVGRGGVR